MAGFTAVASITHDSTETAVSLTLDGIPRSTPTVTRHDLRTTAPLGLLTRLENLAADLVARADQADRKAQEARQEAAKAAARLGQEAARAAARLGQPFEHTGRIHTLRTRLAAIDADLTPVDEHPDTPPDEPAVTTPSGPRPAPTSKASRGAGPTPATPVRPARTPRDIAVEQMARRRAQQQGRGLGR